MLKKIFIILISLVLAGTPFLLPQLLITIRNIDCENQFGKCSNEINEKLEFIKGEKLLSEDRHIKNVLENDFRVKEYQLHFNFPDNYKISVIERKPKFAVTNESKSWFAQIDSEGYVISVVETSNLPSVITDAPVPTTGNKLDKRLLFALELVYFVSNRYQVYSGKLVDNSLSLIIKPFREVLLPLEGEKEIILGQLIFLTGNSEREILNKLENSGNITLDLRYKNPVLKF